MIFLMWSASQGSKSIKEAERNLYNFHDGGPIKLQKNCWEIRKSAANHTRDWLRCVFNAWRVMMFVVGTSRTVAFFPSFVYHFPSSWANVDLNRSKTTAPGDTSGLEKLWYTFQTSHSWDEYVKKLDIVIGQYTHDQNKKNALCFRDATS